MRALQFRPEGEGVTALLQPRRHARAGGAGAGETAMQVLPPAPAVQGGLASGQLRGRPDQLPSRIIRMERVGWAAPERLIAGHGPRCVNRGLTPGNIGLGH
jgi:hypothetical protein